MKLKQHVKTIVKKIVFNFPHFFNIKKMIINDDFSWTVKLIERYIRFNKILPKFKKRWFYEKYIQLYLKKNSDSHIEKSIQKNQLVKVFNNADLEIRPYFLDIFDMLGLLDANIIDLFVSLCYEIENLSERFFLIDDITFVVFINGIIPNNNYYNERRNVFKEIAKQLELNIPQINKKNNNKSLAIITFMLSKDLKNSMERIASFVANGMRNYFNDITIVTLDCFFSNYSETIRYHSDFFNSYSKKSFLKIRKHFDKKINLIFPKKESLKKRMQFCLNKIYELNPGAIIEMTDDTSFLSYYYYKDFKTLFIPSRGLGNSNFYNYILGPKWRYDKVNERFNCIEDNKIINRIFPEIVKIPDKRSYRRHQLGLSEDDFILISINYNNSMPNEYVDMLVNFINSEKNIKLIIVGDKANSYFHGTYQDIFNRGKIIERGYENDLFSLCVLCDVLVRHDFTGSSGCAGIAAKAGLPIVMTDFLCDAVRWLGTDYLVNHSISDQYEELVKLYWDKQYYKIRSDLTKSKIDYYSNPENSRQDLYQIIKGIQE